MQKIIEYFELRMDMYLDARPKGRNEDVWYYALVEVYAHLRFADAIPYTTELKMAKCRIYHLSVNDKARPIY